jgi:hypothetical protein
LRICKTARVLFGSLKRGRQMEANDTWTSLGDLAAMIAGRAERGATKLALASEGFVAREKSGEPKLSREVAALGGKGAGFVKERQSSRPGQHRPTALPFALCGPATRRGMRN